MHTIASFLSLAIAAVFAVTGAIQLAGPKTLLEAFAEWGFGRGFNWVSGTSALFAAAFLVVPQLRAWGVVLAGLMLFGAAMLLFERRKYLFALPNILLLGMLPFALLPG